MARVNDGWVGVGHELLFDRIHHLAKAGVFPSGGSRPAGEERVTGEHDRFQHERHRPGCVSRGVEDMDGEVSDHDFLAVEERLVGHPFGDLDVGGVKVPWHAERLPDRVERHDVIEVTVGGEDGLDLEAGGMFEDQRGFVGGVDDDCPARFGARHDIGVVVPLAHRDLGDAHGAVLVHPAHRGPSSWIVMSPVPS